MTKKNKIIIGAVQLLVVLVLIIMAIVPKKSFTFSGNELNMLNGRVTEAGNAYIDNIDFRQGLFYTTPDMNLNWGTYKATLTAVSDSDSNLFYVTLPKLLNGEEDINDRFYTNVATTKEGNRETVCEVFVKTAQKDYTMAMYYMGSGSISVQSITVIKTAGGYLRLLVYWLLICAAVDCVLMLKTRKREGKLEEDTVKTIFFLGGIITFASIPLFLDYMIEGHDLGFHLLRIEGIKDGILMGSIPVRIQPNWLDGNGYAASIFYGDILLYVPALLRLCGFNITEAYNIYVFLMNAATAIISYFCFKKMSGQKKLAILGSALYTLSLYRMVNIYVRSAVGEYSAMAFLPLIVYGMWMIFATPSDSEGYDKLWIVPTIGFTGIINTHILTCEMTGAFIILLCLIKIKRVFTKKTFLVLVKIVLFTCLLNAAFLVPFFDYMLRGGFAVTSGDRFTAGIQQYGAFLGQVLIPFSGFSGLAVSTANGMAGEFPSASGLAIIIGSVACVYALVSGLIKDKATKSLAIICLVFGGLSIMFSTHLFPWDIFQHMNPLFKKLISMVSMPWRFLSIASMVLVLASVLAAKAIDKNYVVAVLAAVCLVQAGYLMSGVMNTAEPLAKYYDYSLDDSNLIGCEYLPVQAHREDCLERYEKGSTNITYWTDSRVKNSAVFTASNASSEDGYVELSMVYYAGYKAVDVNTGKKLTVQPTSDYKTSVVIPAGYSGQVKVYFAGFAHWILGNIVTVLTLVYIVHNFRKKSKKCA